MNFFDLVRLVEGAKKNRAGAVGKRVFDAAGPTGRASGIDFSTLNPEKSVARKEPKDIGGGGVKDSSRMLKYALEIVGSFDKERADLGRALENHINQVDELRINSKRLQGTLKELKSFQNALDREVAEENPNKDKIKKLQSIVDDLQDSAIQYEGNVHKLDDKIERNLQRKALLGEINGIIKDAATKLSRQLSPQQKENIKTATSIHSLEQLDTGLINIQDPVQLFLIKKAILEPESFSPLDKFYNLSMGQRKDARDAGVSYYFKDPIFHLASLYKSASVKAIFGKSRGSLTSSHAMKSIAKSTIGEELVELTDVIKSKPVRIAIQNLRDYDILSDREKKAVDTNLKRVEDLIHTSKSIDQDKKSKILKAFNDFKQGKTNENNMLGVIYNINEQFNFNIEVLSILQELYIK